MVSVVCCTKGIQQCWKLQGCIGPRCVSACTRPYAGADPEEQSWDEHTSKAKTQLKLQAAFYGCQSESRPIRPCQTIKTRTDHQDPEADHEDPVRPLRLMTQTIKTLTKTLKTFFVCMRLTTLEEHQLGSVDGRTKFHDCTSKG
jgi:hypothetical protein